MVEQNKPHLIVNKIAGGNRTGYPLGDAWAIVAAGLPKTDSNPIGQRTLEIIGMHEGRGKLNRRLKALSKEQGYKLSA